MRAAARTHDSRPAEPSHKAAAADSAARFNVPTGTDARQEGRAQGDRGRLHGGEIREGPASDTSAITGFIARIENGPGEPRRRKAWTITVEPDGNDTISITLPATTSCSSNRGICTDDERKLSHSTSATVEGPVGISVGDVEVEEGAGVVLAFQVALTRAASNSLTVDYATSDGTATAGADYTSTSGTLTIGAGSSSGTIEVPVIDDEHNEGSETFTLTLSNASSGTLTDASATGTITNHDALPAALVGRFGRTAAVHVVDQVEERVNAPRAPGFDGRVAGRAINRDMGQDFALDFLQQLGGGYGAPGAGVASPGGGMRSSLGPQGPLASPGPMAHGGGLQRPMPMGGGLHHDAGFGLSMGGRDQVLQGSGFALNRATSSGGVLSFWSRSAQSSFYGQDGALALNGDVRSTMFGADYSKGRMITGVSLSHSRGLGSYAGVDSGRMTSAVTGLYPWIGFRASERVTVWTVAGYGAGGLLLSPGAGAPVQTGLSMALAAGGGRGELLAGDNGFGLAFKADALWVGTRTDAASGPSGNLEATRAPPRSGGGSLTPDRGASCSVPRCSAFGFVRPAILLCTGRLCRAVAPQVHFLPRVLRVQARRRSDEPRYSWLLCCRAAYWWSAAPSPADPVSGSGGGAPGSHGRSLNTAVRARAVNRRRASACRPSRRQRRRRSPSRRCVRRSRWRNALGSRCTAAAPLDRRSDGGSTSP